MLSQWEHGSIVSPASRSYNSRESVVMPLLERIQPQEESAPDILAEGTVLRDRYRIDSTRRSGKILRSYLATDTHLAGRRCLIQEWTPSPESETGEDGQRFRVGAEIRARLSVPQLPPVLDLFAHNGMEYLVLGVVEDIQTAEGGSGAEGYLAEVEAVRWTLQALGALQPLLGLDSPLAPMGLEPAGVGRRPDGSLVLADIGLVAVGDRHPPDGSATVRELGGLLYHLLVGRAPSGRRIESPRGVNPSLSSEVDAIVTRALGMAGEEIYGTVEALQSDLVRLAESSPSEAQEAPEGPAVSGTISPLWTFKCHDEVRSTPATTDTAIYVGAYDGRMYALSPADGSLLWKYETEKGIASSPYVGQDLLLFGSEDTVFYAVGARTGRLEWMCPTGGRVRSSGRLELDHVFFGSDDGGVYAARSESGRVVWKAELAGPVRSSPAVLGDVVVVGCDDGQVYALNTSTGEVKWRARTGQAVNSSPALLQDLVIVGSGDRSVYGLDLDTGRERWRYRTGGSVISSPVVEGGIAYVGSYDGNMYALDADSGKERWAFEAAGPISSSPRYHQGAVYFGGVDGSVYAVEAKSGDLRWRFATGGPVPGSPAIHDGVVFIGSMDGTVYALPA